MISDNGKVARNGCTQVNKYSESYRASISNRIFATSSTCSCSLLLAVPTQLVRGLPCNLHLGLLSLDMDLELSMVTLTLSQSDVLRSLTRASNSKAHYKVQGYHSSLPRLLGCILLPVALYGAVATARLLYSRAKNNGGVTLFLRIDKKNKGADVTYQSPSSEEYGSRSVGPI